MESAGELPYTDKHTPDCLRVCLVPLTVVNPTGHTLTLLNMCETVLHTLGISQQYPSVMSMSLFSRSRSPPCT